MTMLRPYTVLDFTDERGEIGPMLLGDLGADVIRVELPGGSAARRTEPLLQGAPSDTQSLVFQAFNRNKRSIVLDPGVPADAVALEALITRCDFVFDSHPDSSLAAFAINFETARALNPRIIYVCLSAFGSSGPHAEFLGNDLVLAAMGGPVALQGTADRAPVRLSVPQVWRHAGTEAAAAAMVALHRRNASSNAQFVDVSAQSVMTWTMLNAMEAHAIQGFNFQRGVGFRTGTTEFDIVFATADGYVVALPTSGVIAGCLEWMIADGVADEALRDIDWVAYDENIRDPHAKPLNIYEGVALCAAFFARHSNQELYEFGLQHRITLAPVNTLQGLLDLEHIEERSYWQPLSLADGTTVRSPGLWAKPSVDALSIRRSAPALGEHTQEIVRELDLSHPEPEPAAGHTGDSSALPFNGITVTDFAWVGVGPISGKYLADHGAHVIRVESENRPDVLRGNGPFKDAEPGIDRSQFFGDFNTSKQSISLDMKSPEAIVIAKQLIAKSDVVIESFAPGAIERMGLGYEVLKELNPGVIMISTCLMGQTGPAAQMAGYGYHAGALAGFYEVTGWSDLPPSGPWVAYTDTIAPRFVSLLLGAALDHRRRTGEGCFIDVAQIETALHFLGPEFLDLQVNQRGATRDGNRSVYRAPQGCYPCAGDDNWCAIAIDTDEQWRALCIAINRDDLGSDSALATHKGRLADHDTIDAAIASFTQSHSASDLMHSLQATGVPAGVVQRSSDLLNDPQYAHRNFYHYYDHPVMGRIPYAGHQFCIDGYDSGPRGPAPTLGEHSFEILHDFLDMSDEEIGQAYECGAIH